MQEAISKVIASRKHHKSRKRKAAMDHATEEWVRDTAMEFGFRRCFVKPLATGNDPMAFCRFEVLDVTYEVRDMKLSIVKQTR